MKKLIPLTSAGDAGLPSHDEELAALRGEVAALRIELDTLVAAITYSESYRDRARRHLRLVGGAR